MARRVAGLPDRAPMLREPLAPRGFFGLGSSKIIATPPGFEKSAVGKITPRRFRKSLFDTSGFNNGLGAASFSQGCFGEMQPGNQTVILLAEDEPLVRNMIRNILAASGYLVLDAADGLQAVELARTYEGKIDLLLTDLKMPNLNGAKAAEIIAEERPGISVLVISGHASDEIQNEIASRAFLRKPFVPGVLLRRIQELLGS